LRGFLPFALCFAQLVMIWRTHYRFSRRYGLEDDYTVFLNMVLLFLVLFYVYPLKFVFTTLFSEITGNESGNLGWHEGSVLMPNVCRRIRIRVSAICPDVWSRL